MPTISMFYGILVSMFVLDTEKHHHPHIHIRYNEFKAVLKIPDGELLEGELPKYSRLGTTAWMQYSRLGRATRNPDLMRTTLGFIAFYPAYCATKGRVASG